MNLFNSKKKGQVTIYVILGIVILVSLIGVFFLKDYVFKSQFEREAEKTGISNDFLPIYNSYSNCVSEITLDGIEIMALQGGYIEIPRYEYVPNPLIPFSNRLDFFGDRKIETAYWFYETGNGIKTEKIPTINEMQESLSSYINQNLNSCTSNFTGYDGFNVNNFNNFNTRVQITDSKVFVEVFSNFNVDYKNVNQKFDNLKVAVKSDLGYLYSKAVELYNKQKQENYFEEKTIDYLVVYEDVPYSGESFSCSPRVWSKVNVENDLKQIIEANTDAIGKIDDKYYKIDLGDNSLDTSFIYRKEWPFYMEINGGDEILKEESIYGANTPAANFLTALFCLNNYHFIYDIKYPVLVVLSKGDLDFQFAFEVIIDNNQPKYNLLGEDVLPEIDNRICNSKNTLINLMAFDYETELPLNDVDIEFSCVGTSCDIGKTKANNFGSYSLNEYVPSCVNADIKSYKENYNFGSLILDTNEEVSSYLYMKPYHNLKINVKIVENGNARNLYADESVFVSFLNEEDGFSQFLNEDRINLISGSYVIRSYVMKESEEPIKIEGNTVENCADIPKSGVLGILGLKDKKCFTNKLDDVELIQVLVGGNEYEWSYDGIGNEITVYVSYDKIPRTVNEMADVYGKFLDASRVRYPELK